MSAFGTKLRKMADGDYIMYAHDCPACGCRHYFPTGNHEGPTWTFNGDAEKPTFNPSMNIKHGECHYVLTEGKIHYCPDSRHSLAGMTVDLPDLKEY